MSYSPGRPRPLAANLISFPQEEDAHLSAEEMQKKIERLTKLTRKKGEDHTFVNNPLRATDLGQDRYRFAQPLDNSCCTTLVWLLSSVQHSPICNLQCIFPYKTALECPMLMPALQSPLNCLLYSCKKNAFCCAYIPDKSVILPKPVPAQVSSL